MPTYTLAHKLAKYFEENAFIADVNPGISISTSTPKDPGPVEITVCGTLVNGDMNYVEIFSAHNSYENLASSFGLRSVADLEQIKVEMLQQLYLEERGGILCSVLHDRHILIFRKQGNTTVVYNEQDVPVQVINEVFTRNEAFIEYTLAGA